MGKVRLNNKNNDKNKNESIIQHFYTDDTIHAEDPVDDYVPQLFPDQSAPKYRQLNSFNNTDDIRKINSYLDFLYENGDVYVNGTWYKTPMEALRDLGTNIVKTAILQGQAFRRIGCNKIY